MSLEGQGKPGTIQRESDLILPRATSDVLGLLLGVSAFAEIHQVVSRAGHPDGINLERERRRCF